MKSRKSGRKRFWRALALLCAGLVVLGASAAAQTEQKEAKTPALGKARMNIVFLDDAAEGLPAGAEVRHNHWPEWDARLPTFQKLLRTFIADFHKAQGAQPAAEASLYALEVSATTGAAERDRQIAEYLAAIGKATNRPTLVLARSTAGTDQFRLVYVFDADCPPQQAAGFLAALAEVAPPVFHGRIGERFGPFLAPPTIVFDPRANALAPVPADQKARHRWALLEEDAYLLPHYVLHAVAALHESPLTEEAAWQRDRTVEAGQQLQQITNRFDKANSLRAQGKIEGPGGAKYYENQAVNLGAKLVARTGDINVLSGLTPQYLDQFIRSANRVGNFQSELLPRLTIAATRGVGQGAFTVGSKLALGGTTTVPGLTVMGGGAAALVLADAMQGASNKYINLQQRVNDNRTQLMKTSQDNHVGGGQSDKVGGPLSDPYGLRSINLRPTASELQTFQQSLKESRTSTFGGSGSNKADLALGGVLFQYDNQYLVDLSGRLAKEVAAEAHTRRAARGPVMGTLHYFDDLPLLWLDVAARRDGSLPVSVPRFLTAAGADAAPSFGGPWSFEPLTLDMHRDDQGRLLRATLAPAETRTPISYKPVDLGVDGAPPIMAIRNGTGFEPALEAKNDGRFVWTLRHGVMIEFGADGLVEAIRSPHGEHVAYLREAGRLVGQQTSDGRRIDIQYQGARPEAIIHEGKPRAAYEYQAEHSLVRARGDRDTWSIGYAPNGRPSRIASAATALSLGHDGKGRLTFVESGPMSVRIDYLEGTNTLRLSATGRPAMDWLLGPISGPVMEDRAVLLTRSMAGRILQVSKGPVEGTGFSRRFTPSETIALVRSEPTDPLP